MKETALPEEAILLSLNRGNLEFAEDEFTFGLDSDVCAATELLYRLASMALVLYLAPPAIGDSFSNQPHKSDHIYGQWLNSRYAQEGKKERKAAAEVAS